MHRLTPAGILALVTAFFLQPVLAQPGECFTIRVVDAETGRGVPLVELTTVNNIRCVTDSAGLVAFHEPGLMDQEVFFHVQSHGYRYPQDGFGFRGVRLRVQGGGEAKIQVERLNIAERLYRVTGAGIYRDSQLAGQAVPLRQPVLNAQVFGSDSVVNAFCRGRVYWFWGDTQRPGYPLGNFHVPGAVSRLPADGGLDPSVGVDLEYFTDESGFARPTCHMPGDGPTWIDALVVLNDAGRERLFAVYVKIKPPLTVYQRGLAEFDFAENQFEKVADFDLQAPASPSGHPFVQGSGEQAYVYFGNPFPLMRVRATSEALADLSQYEVYTCLAEGSRTDDLRVQRVDGRPCYCWKKNTVDYTPQLQARLIRSGQLQAEEALFRLHDDSGQPIMIHRGSVCWNEYRDRWIMIAVQSGGSSALGEIWYAESEQLVGPWLRAVKIVSHDRYSFYNPKQHSMFDQAGGRLIYFEGTYTHTFSGNDVQTPRYDYNQIMYRLDLADPRLR